MTQRKGEVTKRRIDRDFPHQVAILIPEGGLVVRLMAMHKFCDTRSIPYKTRSDLRREPPADLVRFCFTDPAHADAFLPNSAASRSRLNQDDCVTSDGYAVTGSIATMRAESTPQFW